ncbi:MAG: DUF695 domain-containing protein [Alphaproteobacteria bacterium]|nr:DUF695 domain-containing protein [Alphaproteobacteria bacterium]
MDDNWDFYFTRIDGYLGSIFFNETLKERAPAAGYASAVYVRLFMRDPRPDGLSSQEEFDSLSVIDDALTDELVENLAAIYAGRATYNGVRDFFYYATDAEKIVSAANTLMTTFSDYKFEIGARADPEWEIYLGYLSPSPRDRQRIENRKVCDALESHGDLLTTKREIDHWAYFPSAESRDTFVARANAIGYTLRVPTERGEPGKKFEAQIFRVDSADIDEINSVTLELFELAQQLGGEYDGWESPVVDV